MLLEVAILMTQHEMPPSLVSSCTTHSVLHRGLPNTTLIGGRLIELLHTSYVAMQRISIMADFTLVDLTTQASAFARYVRGWKVEDILDLMRKYGEVRVILEYDDDRVYSFRSVSGAQTGFRFTGDRRLVIIGDNTSYIPDVYDDDDH